MRFPPTLPLLLLALLLLPGAHAYVVVTTGPGCAQSMQAAPEAVSSAVSPTVSCRDAVPDCSVVFVTIHEDPVWLEPSLKPGCVDEWAWFILELLDP